MSAPTKRYYPALSSLLALTDFPSELDFVKNEIGGLLDAIYYKDLQVTKSPKGNSAFYTLRIISNRRLEFLIPGTDLSGKPGPGAYVVINPDNDSTLFSSFPVTLEYEWKILSYITTFSSGSFTDGVNAFFELAGQILNFNEEQFLARAINEFSTPSFNSTDGKTEQFVTDVNSHYNLMSNDLLVAPASGNILEQLISDIRGNSAIGDDPIWVIFNLYIWSVN